MGKIKNIKVLVIELKIMGFLIKKLQNNNKYIRQ